MGVLFSFIEIIFIEIMNIIERFSPKFKNNILGKYKLFKLRKLTKYAYYNSKFYREIYNKHGITEKDLATIDFNKIPIIKKNDLLENVQDVFTDKILNKELLFEYIFSDNIQKYYNNKYICYTTSGSLGNKFPVIFSIKDYKKVIVNTIFYNAKPLKFLLGRKTRVVMIGLIGGRSAGITIFRNIPDLIYLKKEISLLLPIEQIVEDLNKFDPEQIISYPGVFISLAQYKIDGKLKINPKLICLSGEMLTDENYNKIKSTFKCQVVNSYNASECLNMGLKKNNNPYRLFPNQCHIEILNNENKPAKNGEIGRVIVTNFMNYSQPFIRYEIGDYAINSSINKEEFLFNGIIGRNYKSIVFDDNFGKKKEIFYLTFYGLILYLDGINKSQMHIGKNCFKTLLVGTDKSIITCRSLFEDHLKRMGVDKSVKFVVEKVEDIFPENNGKIPFLKFEENLQI